MTKLSPFPHSLCSAHAQFAPTLTQHYNLIHRTSALLQARTSSIFMVQSTPSTLFPHTCPDLPLLIAHFLPNTLILIYICHRGLKLPIQARAMSFTCVCVRRVLYTFMPLGTRLTEHQPHSDHQTRERKLSSSDEANRHSDGLE